MSQPDISAELSQLLEELEQEWLTRVPAARESLLKPAAPNEIDALAVSLGLTFHVHEDARTLWRWHNGQQATLPRDALHGIWFYRLEDSARFYAMLMKTQDDVLEEDPDFYRPHWLPIFDMAQDSVVIDCLTGEIVHHSCFDGGPIMGRQPSLTAVVRLWLRAIREGAWLFPEPGTHDTRSTDDEARLAISRSPDDLAFF